MGKIVAYEVFGSPPDTPVIIRDSEGGVLVSSDPNDLLSFLRYRHSGVLRVFWDLDDSLAPLLRLLPVPVLESLSRFDDNTMFRHHQLYYLPDRMFRIGKSRFFGIRSFWPVSEPIPETLEATGNRAEDLISTLSRCGMSEIRKLTSPIAVFEDSEMGRELYESLPKNCDIPGVAVDAIQYAYKCGRREWISAYQLGFWDGGDIWDYDINSTYPSVASSLLDMRDMEVWKSKSVGDREWWQADMGFLRGHLYLDPDHPLAHCSPFIFDTGEIPGNPVGDFGDDYYITMDELKFLNRHKFGDFRVEDGWFLGMKSGATPSFPFCNIMNHLYNGRSVSALASSVLKGVANQLVGKLIETRVSGDYGEIRNDVYHATILARARIKLAEFLISNRITPDELVAVQTDGCRIARHIPVSGNGMGSWRCNGTQPTIVASPYKVYVDDRKPGHLTYDHITSLVSEHPLSAYYGCTVKHRTTMRQAIEQGDIGLVGKEEDLPAHLDLNSIPREQNRLFSMLPHTGRALLSNHYQSYPIQLG